MLDGDYFWTNEKFNMLMECMHCDTMKRINALIIQGTIDVFGASMFIETSSFAESLYLMQMYIEGQLLSTPNCESLSNDYIFTSKEILLELCKRGIYPLHGSVPSPILRSCLDFVVCIHDEVHEEFIKLLEEMFTRGVNVAARRVKNYEVIQHHVFAVDVGCFVYSNSMYGTHQLCDIPNGFHSKAASHLAQFSCLFNNMIDNRLGTSGIRPLNLNSAQAFNTYSSIEDVTCEQVSLYYVETWSQTYDNFNVEDILLQLWLPFNGRHGMKNNVHPNYVLLS
jgi:hypothetical protein